MKTTSKLIIVIFTLLALIGSTYAADDSPLFEAVKNGDNAAVEALLVKGADVNVKDTNGRTPLHWAALRGNKDVAQLLLAKGADVNARNEFGFTPLHLVSVHREVAELLLAKGADVNAKGTDGTTPLHMAAQMTGAKDIVELLLDKGADLNAKDSNGKTPLDLAAAYSEKKDIAALLEERVLKAMGNPRAALVQLTARLNEDNLRNNPADAAKTRRLIIKLASELKPAPAIPEEARKHFVEGTAIVKAAKNPTQQAIAAQSFTEALKIAPWWGDAYYNLGVAQELAEKYDEAEQAFNFYLLSNPSETEKREVQGRIYGLSAKRKLAGVK